MKSETAGKKRKSTGLGKGLDALFPDIQDADEPGSRSDYFNCSIDKIRANPYQPRRLFSEDEMVELYDSVKTHGILQPLLVRSAGNDSYEIIAGERRLRAARMAGLETVPVVVKSVADMEMLELSIIENIQRENLNPMEEAEAYFQLLEEFGLTQENVAERVGKSRSAVANTLRLNHLVEEVKNALRSDKISMGHGRAILGSDTPAIQRAALQTVVSGGLSVRETEKLVKRLNVKRSLAPAPEPDQSEAIYFNGLQEDLGRYFGTKVKLVRHGRKGKLEIEFYGNEDLDRILSLLKAGH